MQVQKFLRAIAFVAAFATAGLAQAGVLLTVNAKANSIGGGAALGSGIVLEAGQHLNINVDASQLWNFSYGDSWANTNAAGMSAPEWGMTRKNSDGTDFTAAIGSLVGQIGNGKYFTIGTSWDGYANANGTLKMYYWDSDAFNNSGKVNASVNVPEPASMILLALGLLALAITRRRA